SIAAKVTGPPVGATLHVEPLHTGPDPPQRFLAPGRASAHQDQPIVRNRRRERAPARAAWRRSGVSPSLEANRQAGAEPGPLLGRTALQTGLDDGVGAFADARPAAELRRSDLKDRSGIESRPGQDPADHRGRDTAGPATGHGQPDLAVQQARQALSRRLD